MWHGKAGVAWRGRAQRGAAGTASFVSDRIGNAGKARGGTSSFGVARQARLGEARKGEVWCVWVWQAWLD